MLLYATIFIIPAALVSYYSYFMIDEMDQAFKLPIPSMLVYSFNQNKTKCSDNFSTFWVVFLSNLLFTRGLNRAPIRLPNRNLPSPNLELRTFQAPDMSRKV